MRTRAVVIAAVTIATHTMSAQGVTRETSTVTASEIAARGPWSGRDTIPIAFTFSGGISLGAYQAGVNWGLTSLLRLTRDSAFRSYSRAMSGEQMPVLSIASLAGASAGNINAILTALEACRSDAPLGPAPRESLFWKVWIHTGWRQLFPSTPADGGILDRAYFQTVETTVDSALKTYAAHGNQCGDSIPVGIVVTKVTPDTFQIGGRASGLTGPNQRHVVVFDFGVVDGQFHYFAPPPAVRQAAELGAQLVPIHEDHELIEARRVFEFVTASAAYPLAWAPVALSYHTPDCESNALVPCPSLPGLFIDGGVFDNNPVGLAFDLDHLTRPASRGKRSGSDAANIVYVEPDALRSNAAADQLASARAENENDLAGLSAAARFATGFVPTARRYELEAFGRSLARDAIPTPFIDATNRAHPIVGEHLYSFAAFLGEPFREFDFYAGVADAIHFSAANIVCHATRVPSMPQRLECIRAMEAQIDRVLMGQDAIGRPVVESLLMENDPDLSLDFPVAPPMALSQHSLLLLRVGHAVSIAARPPAPGTCRDDDIVDDLLCADGFGPFLSALGRDQSIRATLDRWPAACAGSRADCESQPTMVDLIHDPHDQLRTILAALLDRLEEVEASDDGDAGAVTKPLVKTLEYGLHSTGLNSARGILWDPSSVPSRADLRCRVACASPLQWSVLYHFLPYYVGATLGGAGSVIGWQPAYHGTSYLSISLPLEVTHYPSTARDHRENVWYTSASPSLVIKTGGFVLSQIGAGWRVASQRLNEWHAGNLELCAFLVGNKVRVSAYRVPAAIVGIRKYSYAGTISFADLNGMLYWAFR